MYIQEISIEIASNANEPEIIYELDLLMTSYRKNGQILGEFEPRYIEKNRVVIFPITPEKRSLIKKLNNYYVKKQIKIIEKLCNSNIKIKPLSRSYDNYLNCCKCKKSEFYILTSSYSLINPPIFCGTCHKPVPLYKFPKYYNDNYEGILHWDKNYKACDRLFMSPEVGSRWAQNQLQKLDSQLSKQGIEICTELTGLTGIPTYYYLMNFKKEKGDQSRRLCPSCNNKWNLEKKLHSHYDYKCDTCNLISTYSVNV